MLSARTPSASRSRWAWRLQCVLMVVLMAALLTAGSAAAKTGQLYLRLSGGSLPGPVEVAGGDFSSALAASNGLSGARVSAVATGSGVSYQEFAVRFSEDGPDGVLRLAATPESSIVITSEGGSTILQPLHAILVRYIELRRAGLIGERPTQVEVIRASAEYYGGMTATVAGKRISEVDLLAALGQTSPVVGLALATVDWPAIFERALPLTLSWPGGGEQQFLYIPGDTFSPTVRAAQSTRMSGFLYNADSPNLWGTGDGELWFADYILIDPTGAVRQALLGAQAADEDDGSRELWMFAILLVGALSLGTTGSVMWMRGRPTRRPRSGPSRPGAIPGG